MDKILQMLKLQQKLNDETNGIGWEKGITKNGKIINWKRCSYLECAELIESYPWKHWKNIEAKADYDNIKIEVVDIWHFIMSQALQEYKIQNLASIEDLASDIISLDNFASFLENPKNCEEDYYAQIELVEKLIKTLFCEVSTKNLISAFIDVAIQSGLNLDSLYKLYVGKNILNKFRQDHGYKDGSYIKIWNNEEDNVVMQRILENHNAISPKELYQKLQSAYPAQ